jgi:hypothetical protein
MIVNSLRQLKCAGVQDDAVRKRLKLNYRMVLVSLAENVQGKNDNRRSASAREGERSEELFRQMASWSIDLRFQTEAENPPPG